MKTTFQTTLLVWLPLKGNFHRDESSSFLGSSRESFYFGGVNKSITGEEPAQVDMKGTKVFCAEDMYIPDESDYCQAFKFIVGCMTV
jgi:hypothetical protein